MLSLYLNHKYFFNLYAWNIVKLSKNGYNLAKISSCLKVNFFEGISCFKLVLNISMILFVKLYICESLGTSRTFHSGKLYSLKYSERCVHTVLFTIYAELELSKSFLGRRYCKKRGKH